jgi:hypothetical protein
MISRDNDSSIQIFFLWQQFQRTDINFPAVSHIQDFGDATVSPAGDAVSPAVDAETRMGDVHLQG